MFANLKKFKVEISTLQSKDTKMRKCCDWSVTCLLESKAKRHIILSFTRVLPSVSSYSLISFSSPASSLSAALDSPSLRRTASLAAASALGPSVADSTPACQHVQHSTTPQTSQPRDASTGSWHASRQVPTGTYKKGTFFKWKMNKMKTVPERTVLSYDENVRRF